MQDWYDMTTSYIKILEKKQLQEDTVSLLEYAISLK